MLNIQLARKYSRAIFEIAQEEDKLVEYGKELDAARKGLESVPQAIEFRSNPQVEPKVKKDLLKKCFKQELSQNVYHFLLLLVTSIVLPCCRPSRKSTAHFQMRPEAS